MPNIFSSLAYAYGAEYMTDSKFGYWPRSFLRHFFPTGNIVGLRQLSLIDVFASYRLHEYIA